MSMKMYWMCDLIVDIHCNQLNNIVEIHFDPVSALACNQKFIVEAMLTVCRIFSAIL